VKNKIFLAAMVCCLLCSCADGFDQNVVNIALTCTDPGGFWWGLWNGMTAGLAFVASLFTGSISCYDVCNTGGWYWFGYLLGVGAFAGSSSGAASYRR